MPARAPSFVRKKPAQARARATVEAILQAAAHILTRKGYDALTTNHVAERAGVSIGSLYQYFPNKDAILVALASRHLDDIERTIDEAMARRPQARSFPDIVRSMIEANIAAHRIDPSLHSALSERLPLQGADDWRRTFDKRVMAKVRAILQAHQHELAVRDLDLATYIIVRSVEACVHDACWQRPGDLKNGSLAGEVSELVINYLTAAPRR